MCRSSVMMQENTETIIKGKEMAEIPFKNPASVSSNFKKILKEEAADFCERQKLRDRKERHADQFQTVTIDEGVKPRGAKERYRVCFGSKYVLHVAWLSNFS